MTFTKANIVAARAALHKAQQDLDYAKLNLETMTILIQTECVHANVDTPGSVFGETCLDCDLYLNNGF